RNDWKGKDRIHFWNMENELNWTCLWRSFLAKSIANKEQQWAWLDGNFTKEVIETIRDAIEAEDPLAIKTHNFNTAPMMIADILAILQVMTGHPGLALPNWAVGWYSVLAWKDYVDVVGLGAYPNYIWSDPVLGYAVAPYVLTASQLTGKPAMVVESGYPTSPNLSLPFPPWWYTEENQAEYIRQAIPLTQEVSALLLLKEPQTKCGLGFIYWALATGEEQGEHKFLVMENYQGLMHLPNDPRGLYKEGFYAFKDTLCYSSLIDTTWQSISQGYTTV
ncbi:unnamed protein product, partial [marine sediment metagenome]